MEFRLLGPLAVVDDGRDLAPRRAQQRMVLAILLMRRNAVVPVDDLLDALWGDDPPETAQTALHVHVSALRKALGQQRIETRAPGYVLRVDASEVDVERLESTLAAARATRTPAERLELLRGALALWRGEPLGEFRDQPFAQAAISGIAELGAAMIEERIQAELDLGRHAELVAELERRVRAQPLRERLRGQLMLALYRSGREADALHAYQDGRRHASEELGLDPGAPLQLLERQILARDPALDLRSSSPTQPEQARKHVTVVVAEFTTSSSDPEDAERLGPLLSRARALMESHGASVEPLFSSSLVGIFGARRAYEDDGERSLRAAFAIRDGVGDTTVRARIGIDSGRALVTIKAERVDVAGGVLTEASRLAAAAPFGAIVVSADVHRAASGVIDFERRDDGSWLARVPREARPTRYADVREVPFVGRAEELSLLERARERASGRVAQLLTIVGEPGAGKTRLVREFRERRSDGATWREGRCLPYGSGITLWALGEIVKQEAGITESDDPDAALAKLSAALESIVDVDDRAWIGASLASLVGARGSTEGDRDQLFAAAQRFIEGKAWHSPVVLVFEDLHWADPALLDFVERLTDRVSGAALLVICTARPELLESRPTWGGGRRNAAIVTLPPLAEDDTRRVIGAVLTDTRIPPELVRRAGGNPLFALELARIVDASGHERVPESIEAVIAARLDTLSPEVRAAATDAAVVGEVFWPGAVAAVGAIAEAEVVERMRRLIAGDFVRRHRASSVRGQDEYAFTHALVRDVAYDRIPRRNLSEKHERAATWIEALAAGRAADRAELIAHHYGTALGFADADSDRAIRLRKKSTQFLLMAADRALHFDVGAAERLYRRALDIASADEPLRPAIVAGLATAVQESGLVHESLPLYEEAIRALDAEGADEIAAHARLELARALWNVGQTKRHRELVDEAIERLERRPVSPDLARAWLLKGRDVLMQGGDARVCLEWMERAIRAAEQVGELAVKVRSMQFRGLSHWELGDQRAGVADLEEALRLGRDGGVGFETAMCYSNLAEVVARRDGPAHGLPILRDGIEFAERRGLVFAAMWMRATEPLLLFETGAWDEVLERGTAILEWDRARGTTQITRIILSLEVEIYVDRGELDRAAPLAAELLPMARRTGDVQALMEALPAVARLERARGNVAAARDLIEGAREASSANPAWRSHRIADCMRTALECDDLALAIALLSNVDTTVPRAQAAVLSARAALAEARHELKVASDLYADAVRRWREFGHRVELGYALLGLGRCLVSLGKGDDANAALDDAQTIFTAMKATALVTSVGRARRQRDATMSPAES